MRGLFLGLAAGASALIGVSPVAATILTYTIDPPNTPATGQSYPSHPISFSFDTAGPGFQLDYRSGSGYIDVQSHDIVPFTGSSVGTLSSVYYVGYGDPLTGIVSVLDLYPDVGGGSAYFDLYDELITFRNRAPIFKTGSFTISDQAGQLVHLSITTGGASAVPEPSTWALQLVGFGLVGWSLRGVRSGRARPIATVAARRG